MLSGRLAVQSILMLMFAKSRIFHCECIYYWFERELTDFEKLNCTHILSHAIRLDALCVEQQWSLHHPEQSAETLCCDGGSIHLW